MSAFNISLSGLNAAEKRIGVAAQNIANQQSQNYKPQVVEQTSQGVGGVDARVTTDNRDSIKVFSPDDPSADENGFLNLPNVDTAEELVNMQTASYDFKANLKVIKVQNDMLQNLLDIKA